MLVCKQPVMTKWKWSVAATIQLSKVSPLRTNNDWIDFQSSE